MTAFDAWIAEVQNIAISRNLLLSTTRLTGPQGQQWVTFNWRAANNSRFGSSGAGAEFIGLTTPAEFTWDWYGINPPNPKEPPPPVIKPVDDKPWERHGRYVPRVPAIAVADALLALFKLETK